MRRDTYFEALYKISEVSHKLGVAQATLRSWETKGIVEPSWTLGGQRRYSQKQIDDLLALIKSENPSLKGKTPRMRALSAKLLAGFEL